MTVLRPRPRVRPRCDNGPPWRQVRRRVRGRQKPPAEAPRQRRFSAGSARAASIGRTSSGGLLPVTIPGWRFARATGIPRTRTCRTGNWA